MKSNGLKRFLKKHHISMTDLATASGIPRASLYHAIALPLPRISVRYISALAMMTSNTAGQVLDEMITLEGDPLENFVEAHELQNDPVTRDVRQLIAFLKQAGISLEPITFNRYEEEIQTGKHPDDQANARRALENTRAFLQAVKAQFISRTVK